MKKVGIIGAGAAGLVAAWLLEEKYEVLLFEKNGYVGGHAHTIHIPSDTGSVSIDCGFEFFNITLFPYFNKLLAFLEVPISSFPLTHTFYTQDGTTILLPPYRKSSTLITQFFTYAQLWYFIKSGSRIVTNRTTTVTLEEYAQQIFFLSKQFKNSFLYPFLASGWGTTIAEFKHFAAYDILKWASKASNRFLYDIWYEIVGGTATYCNALEKQLHATNIYKETEIKAIKHLHDSYVIATDHQEYVVDVLVIATSPQQATELLTSLEHANKIKSILGTIESFPATLAIHGDQRYMPNNRADWSITNIMYDGHRSSMTLYKPWKHTNIFKSWLTPHRSPPEPLYELHHFNHQKVTPAYFQAQTDLNQVQGMHNLWIIGHYTHDIDSHENAIVSALQLAKKIAPQSKRLKCFQ